MLFYTKLLRLSIHSGVLFSASWVIIALRLALGTLSSRLSGALARAAGLYS